ncbi:serine threonine-protein kinase nek2 [Diplodia corticola]|uniref:non-specific serine/threonine protein kinase n=1 Tax=Diplodia corticola TaxID=236234 RepID=A0A1J9RS45_9PEZI|nr:serine threonine-protein kinase nek2 [Diplodia corticola]OJD30349.1 serine threonine-protein kinase nek2 [Diplodia corticola]
MIAREPTDRYDLVRPIRHVNHLVCGIYVVGKEGDEKSYVKKIAVGRPALECIFREYRALKVLDHPNIIKMMEAFADMDALEGAIVVEYHTGGDLLSLVNDHIRTQQTVGADTVTTILKNLAAALAYCHHGIRTPNDPLPAWDPIIHKDMKLENVFLHPDNTAPGGLTAILGDFGWATNERCERALRRRPRGAFRSPGDPNWRPPESPRITEKSDVWGLAAVVACVCQLVVVPRGLLVLQRRLRRPGGGEDYGGVAPPPWAWEWAWVVDAGVYGERVGEVVAGMGRVDVGGRWDSRRVLGEVEGLELGLG